MDISIFLAKALSIYLVVIGISLLLNQERYKEVINDITKTPTTIIFSGALALIFGILIVLSHNIWEVNWKGLITLIGWLSLIKGTVRVVYPQLPMKMARMFVENSMTYYITTLIMLVIGVYLAYMGFWAV